MSPEDQEESAYLNEVLTVLLDSLARKIRGKWYLVIDYRNRRKTKVIGADRKLAEQVRRAVEAKLSLGDMGIFAEDDKSQSFDTYADAWMKDYARVECKKSTADGYEGVLRQYLRPRFGKKQLDQVSRDDIKGDDQRANRQGSLSEYDSQRTLCNPRNVQPGCGRGSTLGKSGIATGTLHPHRQRHRDERYGINVGRGSHVPRSS